jgi:hypothetical protein
VATKKTASAKSSRSNTKKKPARTAKKKTTASPKQRKSTRSRAANSKSATGEKEVTIDRRRTERREETLETDVAPAAPPIERRKKVQRRRQIDPTTCERDYTDAEVEFMNAMDEYKRKNGRMFPTCSEVLEVVRNLGYVQLSPTGRAMLEQDDQGNAAMGEAEFDGEELSGPTLSSDSNEASELEDDADNETSEFESMAVEYAR